MAIQNYLRSVEFTYSLQSPVQGGYDGNGLSVLADFLTQKSGYCIHFASAMAVMARLEGIPSRIAVGYAPGRSTGATVSVPGQGALPEYEVDSRDAHAWPELYFQGLGWVAFEPTPSRGFVPDYASQPSTPGGASTNENNDGLIPSNAATPGVTPSPTPAPLPGLDSSGAAGNRLALPLYGALGVLFLGLLAATPRLVRVSLRSRRLRGTPASGGRSPESAWSELQDLATDYGVPPVSAKRQDTFPAGLGVRGAGRAGRSRRRRCPRGGLAHRGLRTAAVRPAARAHRGGRKLGGRRSGCRHFGGRQDRPGPGVPAQPLAAGEAVPGGMVPAVGHDAMGAGGLRAVPRSRPSRCQTGAGRRAVLADGARRPATVAAGVAWQELPGRRTASWRTGRRCRCTGCRGIPRCPPGRLRGPGRTA
ncbi:transglutaminase-like domain-containing protein [Arthrobacter sp. 24S4-2]|uniref:transglutaminase-like domain-containing protein n=1 Tax=Arthrobacter sp. 24S4-2 TaxID=2575374 RepID=UPI0034A0BA51